MTPFACIGIAAKRVAARKNVGLSRMDIKAEYLNSIDVHVGSRLRLLRISKKLSQVELAKAIGVSFELVQQYERGICRIRASHLYHASKFLDVPVAYFFEVHGENNVKPKEPYLQIDNIVHLNKTR